MALPAAAALAFLPFAILIGLWVAWNDMKFMKIPNAAVVALALVYLIVGPFVLPWKTYLWQLSHLPIVLVVGFLANLVGSIGAGDAKFAAAMAPFVATPDLRVVLLLTSSILLAAFVSHRGLGRIPAFRRAASDWASWERRDFPMGLALGGILIFYLGLAACYGG
ncbi:hypothetical protein FGG78_20380 [Thioclava sp. BHET1]|nr:hypothetical protein FGG78_20380 [Thioclava sp. BHET1]